MVVFELQSHVYARLALSKYAQIAEPMLLESIFKIKIGSKK